MKDRLNPQAKSSSEGGFVLLTVIFLLTLLIIAMSVAAPKIAKQIQRDREVETMQRGKQYQRAVQLYYRKFGAYPPNVNALVMSNNIRFLRKRYTDPMTGKDDWKPILWGQNKTPTAMGFFGQPLASSAMGGIGPGGAMGSPMGNGQMNNGLSGGIGGATGSSSLFNSPDSSGGASAQAAASQSGASAATGTDASAGGTDTSGGSGSSSGSGSTSGPGSTSGAGSFGSPSGGTSPGSPGTNSSTGLSGQTFGGAGIIGFEPGSPKPSILVYKKKQHYNEWEFTYSPLQDQMMMQGGNVGNSGINGQPASSTSSPVGSGFGSGIGSGSGSGFGSGSGVGTGSGFGGNSPGFGTGSTPPTSPQ